MTNSVSTTVVEVMKIFMTQL